MRDPANDFKPRGRSQTFYAVHAPKDPVDQFPTRQSLAAGRPQFVEVSKGMFYEIFNLNQKFALRLVHGRIVNS
jgi:hypothetical protein